MKSKHKKRARIAFGGGGDDAGDESRIKRKTKKEETYEDFKKIVPPDKPPFPESLESPYLNMEKNKAVWEWMTRDDIITDFNYFLTICK